ncbi:MAG: radical SAM family heme chaperone HemW [Bacteroidetes bacterium]|nr:radical SAM family heme chaperone HemW [Bacteroidota bacterium]
MAGIYVHIPFCRKFCHYCDFYHVISDGDHASYIEALLKEADIRKEYLDSDIISSIYLGGGTPSVFSLGELDKILSFLRKNYMFENDCEITIELNPDDISRNYVKGLIQLDINRLSLGIQSWRDEDLKMLNRRHDSKQISEALEIFENEGFDNVSADLIYGLPGMNVKDLEDNLKKTFSYNIKHLSAYLLSIEEGTVFYRMKKKGNLEETDEEESIAEFNRLIEITEEAGFIHYEISNFGKEGYFSVHNTNYWKQIPYIGLGPSAHSFNRYSRQWNLSDLKKYIKAVNNDIPFYEKEEIDLKTKFNEYILTSLRTMWGIDLEYVENTFEKEGYDYIINLSGKFINYGLMEQKEKALMLTNQGKMISDNIISEFIMPQ